MTSLLIMLAMPDEVIARYRDPLCAHFPDIEVNAVNHRDKIGPYIADADILLTFGAMMADEVFRQAARLQWVQLLGTGVDRVADAPSLRQDAIITNIRGIHGAPVAEGAIAFMLGLSRELPRSVRAQDRREWERFPARLLDGKTVGMFGVGVIAEALAPRCQALGMRVEGVSSVPRPVPGFDRIFHRDALAEAVRDWDYFVLLTPHTPATYRAIDETVFRAMKRGSYFINLGRGETVDEAALIRALDEGRLAGAALDVFALEPLPRDHVLWTMRNVMITPHLGGFYDEYPDRCLPVVEENLRRFLGGERAHMINLVNRGTVTP